MFKHITKTTFLILSWTVYAAFFPILHASGDLADTTKSTIIAQEKKLLCLTMIVKNESRIIERCLQSVKDIVDCISICDTGSSDNTIEIIEQFMKKNGIPGQVHRHTWKNFGHNRTLSAEAAQKTLEQLKFPLSQTYLLLLDADMMLEIGADFIKNDLSADYYLVPQKNFCQTYSNVRLARASLPWESVGATHEYWSCRIPAQLGILPTLVIDDREDGGCKADKFERDIKLLTQGLIDEPDNERYMFYLAQSYKCLQKYNEAIKWYQARINKGWWLEGEVWYSKCMIGECYQEMGIWDQALHWYLDAFQSNPERAEPLHKIATYYRENSQNNLAYLFAKQGSFIPYPQDQIFFVNHPVYDYLLDEEMSIAGYYTPFKKEGYAAADRLAHKKDIPDNIKEQTYKNLLYYVQKLKNAYFKPIDIEQSITQDEPNFCYTPLPTFIQKKENGYQLFCKTILQNNKKGKASNCGETLGEKAPTKFFVIDYDDKWQKLSCQAVSESFLEKITKSKMQSQNLNQNEGVTVHSTPHDFSRFRNSTAPLAFDNGYLMLVHEVVKDDQPVYLHRFVFLDSDFKIKQLTKPFVFMHKGFESCSEMIMDLSGKECIIPVDVENQKAYLVFIDHDSIRSLLEPLP